jgi:mannosyltransferase
MRTPSFSRISNRAIGNVSVVILFISAVLLRLYNLSKWPFWGDELFTVEHSLEMAKGAIAFSEIKFAPLPYLLIKPVLLFLGVNEFSARIIPALAGVIAIPVFYLLVSKAFNRKVALVCCAIITFSPWHLYWSQFSRCYSILFLLTGTATFLFYIAVEKGSYKHFISSMLITILSMLTHTSAVLLLPAFFLYTFFTSKWLFERTELNKQQRRFFLSGILFLGIIFLIFVFGVSGGSSKITWGSVSGDSPIHLMFGFLYNTGLVISIISFFSLIFLLWNKQSISLLLMLYIGLPIIVLCAMSPIILMSGVRYLFFITPGIYVLSAYGVVAIYDSLRPGKMVLGIALLIAVLASESPRLASYFMDGDRPDYRKAAAFIKKNAMADDIIAAQFASTFSYYLGKDVESLAITKSSLENFLLNRKKQWFIIVVERTGIMNDYSSILNNWLQKNTIFTAEFRYPQFDMHDHRVQIYYRVPEQ